MLTDAQVKRAKPRERNYKLADGEGLHLLVTAGGTRAWRLKYRFLGKEKLLSFGVYPAVSIAEARRARDAAKAELRAGRDPSIEKKKRAAAAVAAAGNSFEMVAREWQALNAPRWSVRHAADVIAQLERDVFGVIGHIPIAELNEALILDCLRKIERRGAVETAKRQRQRIEGVCTMAAAAGMRQGNPAAGLEPLLKPLPKKGKQPAITDLEDLRQLMRAVESADARVITKLANRFLALTAVRSGAQCAARWDELEGIGGRAPLWRVPPASMKLRVAKKDDVEFEHLVPLSSQAVAVIEAMRPLTGHLPYVFPNDRHAHRPMSNNAVRALMIRVADGRYRHRHCPHGWRSSFSTIMNEWRRERGRPDDREVINLMLAHVAEDKVEGAYNRAAHMDRRYELAQIWADMLLEGMPSAVELLPVRARAA